MITCPWCGTNYAAFQTNCKNCGGPLPFPAPDAAPSPVENVLAPPPAPRAFKDSFAWRQLVSDGWAIAAGVFLLLGVIFTLLGTPLTVMIITAFVGLPFAGMGLLFLGAGIPIFIWRYQKAQQTLNVLRVGQAALGSIVDVYENYSVQVNNRHPWTIAYRFQASGHEYDGKTTTLRPVGFTHQPGQPVYVLYLESDPAQSTIYPPVL
jgi:hypothetical protein